MIWSVVLGQAASVIAAQALIAVEVPEAVRPSDEKRARPERPFFTQPRIPAGEAEIRLDPKALDAFRNQFDLDDHAPFALYEWVDRGPPASRHRGFVFCSVYMKLGKGACAACFQDSDRDGRLDAVARFEGGIPSTGLAFEPLPPLAYRYLDKSGEKQGHSMYTQPHLSLSYKVDERSGHLLFSPGIEGFALEPVADVDPATLPQTITVSGAVIRVSAWDGKRATLAVERPFPQVPLRVEWPDTRLPEAEQFSALVFASEPIPGR